MTLVVAKKINDEFRIFSDTKKTSPEELLRGVNNSVLKCVILNPVLCVCFAGNVGRANLAIQKLYSKLGNSFNLEETLKFLLNENLEGNGDTDFIIATLSPISSLYRIWNGKIEQNQSFCYVGNESAFSTFQKYLLQIPGIPRDGGGSELNEILDDIWKMKRAMQRIVEGKIHASVGEFVIEVGTDSNGFYYEKSYIGYPSTIKSNFNKGDDFREFAASSGSYSFAILTPEKSGIGAIGIHFYEGNIGALYYPMKDENPKLYKDVTEQEFKECVFKEFDFNLKGQFDD